MEFDQAVRQQWRRIRARIAQWHTRAGLSAGRAADAGRDAFEHPRAGLAARGALIAVLVLFVLYPALAWWHSTIDDDLTFSGTTPRPGMSHAVANAAALINREVHKHGWTANAPWFSPNALLDDMPNYQTGMIEALATFASVLNERIGHPASDPDTSLQDASDLLHYRPDIWVWNPGVSLWPKATSGSQYRHAAKALRVYNQRLAGGQTAFARDAGALRTLLDRIASDLDMSGSRIETHLDTASGWPFDTVSDDVFYEAKGKLYAYDIVLKGAGADYAAVIASRGLARPWAAMMQSLGAAAAMRPWIVMNGAPDSGLFACTLCGEGLYLLRARDQMRAIRDSLGP